MKLHYIPLVTSVETLDEFEQWIKILFACHAELLKKRRVLEHYPLLFRGHKHSAWNLATTLERVNDEDILVSDYFRRIRDIMPKLSTQAKKNWTVDWKFVEKVDKSLRYNLLPISDEMMAVYEYMAYLRHHSFPSPLMDWTTSPYIAAYFAFDDLHSNRNHEQDQVSIYCYLETGTGRKTGTSRPGMIYGIGPDLRTHQRHYLQKSQYTICFRELNGMNYFGNHELVIESNADYGEQDFLYKATIPFSLRAEFMKRLKLMNVDAFSLFANEDGLVKSLANESFIGREHPIPGS